MPHLFAKIEGKQKVVGVATSSFATRTCQSRQWLWLGALDARRGIAAIEWRAVAALVAFVFLALIGHRALRLGSTGAMDMGAKVPTRTLSICALGDSLTEGHLASQPWWMNLFAC